VDDEIIVSLPGTSYGVTYYKRANSPQLLARNISHTDDFRTPLKLSDFLSRAWHAANDKARERWSATTHPIHTALVSAGFLAPAISPPRPARVSRAAGPCTWTSPIASGT